MNADWQQVEEIFHAALEMKPDERAAYLSEACATDPELLAEVASLLSAHEEAGDFIATPAFTLAADLLTDSRIENREGERISHYEILALLGRGGMGEVYLARDSRLDRRIALKLLPAIFTENRDRLRRFTQEARAASALNHPNILTIHEVGEENGTHFIATEFIEGQTLRRRIGQGALDIGEALDIAMQAAGALNAAHQAGIVHRDIKPENIMLRPDGLVKVLDFGLVKLAGSDEEAPAADQNTPAETARGATAVGAVMGTFAYMSPEQAGGRSVDARSDLFSLGVVLFEMVAGRPPFDGETPAAILDQILNADAPPLSQFVPDAPAELQRIVARALARDREARYRSARELLEDLQDFKQRREFEAKLDSSRLPAGRGPAAGHGRWLWAGAGVLLLAVLAAVWWAVASRRPPADANIISSLRRVEVTKWKSESGDSETGGTFSPDGARIAYSVMREGRGTIWVREPDGGLREVLSDEWNNSTPIWSPDGAELAFTSNRGGRAGIWRMPAAGGEAKLVRHLEAGWPKLKMWSKRGATIYFESSLELFRLDVKTGEVSRIVQPDQNGQPVNYAISPDETRVAYVLYREGSSDIWVRPLNGAPYAITQDAAEDQNPVWHPDGRRVIYNSNRDGTYQICIAYVDGRQPLQITFGETDHSVAGVSADGSRILYISAQEDSDIWKLTTDGEEEVALTSDVGVELWPDVSPDGRAVVFQTAKDLGGGRGLFNCSVVAMSTESPGAPLRLAGNGYDPRWSPDGRHIAFLRQDEQSINLHVVGAGGGEPRRITERGVLFEGFTVLPYNRGQTRAFSWSPDGGRIAYCGGPGLATNVYVASVGGGETAVTDNQDANLYFNCALWSPDGSRIAYSSATIRADADGKRRWGFGVSEGGSGRRVYLSEQPARLLGWNRAGTGLLVVESRERKAQLQGLTGIRLIEVPLEGEPRHIADLESVYFFNIELAPGGREVAYVARLDQREQIWLVGLADGARRRIRTYADQKMYISSLVWTPDGRALYFSKQSRQNVISMIENFR